MNKNKDNLQELKAILNLIDEDVANLSDEEIDNELCQSGEQLEKVVDKMKIAQQEALNAFKMRKLNEAREKRLSMESLKKSVVEKIYNLSREDLIKSFNMFPKAVYALREQNKNIDAMNTEDLRGLLEDLTIAEELKKVNEN